MYGFGKAAQAYSYLSFVGSHESLGLPLPCLACTSFIGKSFESLNEFRVECEGFFYTHIFLLLNEWKFVRETSALKFKGDH